MCNHPPRPAAALLLRVTMASPVVLASVAADARSAEPEVVMPISSASQPYELDTDTDAQPGAAGEGTDVRFTFGGGYTYRFSTDIDSGGDFTQDALSFGLNIERMLNRDASLIFRVDYGFSSYDFSGGVGAGFGQLDPWSDINTLTFGGALSYDLNDQITVFGGPLFQFSQETGADWGEGFTGGGTVGMTYHFNPRLHVGGGVGIVSQIEDDVRFFPIIIVEWIINDQWRISSRGPTGGRVSIEFTGVELIWAPSNSFEFGLGGGSSFSRFRLDDEGANADGVGQDESTPLWLRATWRANDTFNISAVGGVAFGGELSLDDSSGSGVARSDYDIAPIVGVFASVKF